MKKLSGLRAPRPAFLVPLMLIISLAMVVSCFAEDESVKLGDNFDGSSVLPDLNDNPKHDTVVLAGSATRTYKFKTSELKGFLIDIESNTNATVYFYPIPYFDDQTVRGELSKICAVTGGTPKRCGYIDIGSPYTEVDVTNDSASAMTTYHFGAHGWQK